ncbi:L7Ae/L30e/S12e/Gadd45 family ribosomal protein [Anaeromicropila populeti]|uniref:Ribosomal protein L7Ae n=1 Tax=Anaeromicropila populeti TaxID=37658 RepID=A0A1I6JRW6_9FIRM|nr:ribosomal L7Ae/L30e/S12e/Gadd45 family protein [Anaeromicropila populeti]SFR81722.1 Ribosomal protein L7Ae [Anaeromicropila populeti]
MNKVKAFSYIGLGMKSGNVACGEFLTEKAVKEKRAFLVIVAEDASQNTKKSFTNMCSYYSVPIYFIGSKDELGHAMGKEMRASLAFLDQGLARAVEKQLL